jgi:hypothetical protein
MPGSPLPQRQQRLGDRLGQPGRVRQIREQTGADVAHHATPIRCDNDPWSLT